MPKGTLGARRLLGHRVAECFMDPMITTFVESDQGLRHGRTPFSKRLMMSLRMSSSVIGFIQHPFVRSQKENSGDRHGLEPRLKCG